MTVPDRMIPAEAAFAASTKNRAAARWPRRGGDNRLEPFAQVKLQPRFSIAPTDVVFTIGSCFARNIEEYLARMGMRVPTLDFTVPAEEASGRPSAILNKYTVPSILQEVERAARAMAATEPAERAAIIGETLLDMGDGTVIDMELVGLAPTSRERGLERRQQIHDLYARAFESEVVTLTFGLVEAWYDHQTGRYIQETPPPGLLKRFPGRFGFVMLDYQTCLEQARRTIATLNATGGPKKIIITTSPVPLARSFSGQDILIANCLAKSTLRAMCQALFHDFDNVDYFPSYEMVTLSRDPSVWQDDLIHVSDAFVGRIVNTLMDSYSPGLVAGLNANAQAWLLLRDRKNTEAMALLENANDKTGLTLLGLAMIGGARRPEGIALVRDHAADADLAVDQALWASNILVALEVWDTAAIVLDVALASRKAETRDTAVFLARRAICADAMGDAAAADGFMERARETHDSLPVTTLASRLAMRRERLDEARELTMKVVSMHRGTNGTRAKIAALGAAYATLADIATRQGDRDAALRYCDDALWHGSDNPRYQALRRRIESSPAAE